MAIPLDEPGAGRAPVIKSTAIGQRFFGILAHSEKRPRQKDGAPLIINGKQKFELVLTFIARESTCPVGRLDELRIPEPADTVRVIHKGLSYSQWIDASKAVGGAQVGDMYEYVTDTAQAYDENAEVRGPKLTTQAQIDALPRAVTVGIYGTQSLRRPTPEERPLVEAAERLYHEIVNAAAAPAITLEESF